MDQIAMMEQAKKDYRKQMEASQESALQLQERLAKDLGTEVTAKDRQDIIDNHKLQIAQYEAMMDQQIQMMKAYASPGGAGQMEALLQQQLDAASKADEEAYEAFLKENAVPKEYRKYMPIGALLIGTHSEPYETLRSTLNEGDAKFLLEDGWGIKSRKDGLETLETLFGNGSSSKFDKDFESAKAGNFDQMDGKYVKKYQASVQGIIELLSLPIDVVNKCKTLYGWNLERIGYLVRLFVNAKFITEDEAWEWMSKVAPKVKASYSSWEEYIVSILIGRAFAIGLSKETYAVALDLLTDSRAFLDENPISRL